MKSGRIFKYPLGDKEVVNLQLPDGAKILSAGHQDGKLMLWVHVDPSMPTVRRTIRVVGTGWEFEGGENFIFIGTVHASPYVWHIFEES